jgi:hypothetical protein
MKNSLSSGKFQVRQQDKRLELPSEAFNKHRFGARINVNQDANNNSVLVNKIDSVLLDIRSTLVNKIDSMVVDIRSAFSIAKKEIENPFVEVIDIIREKNKNFYLQIQELAPRIEEFFLVFFLVIDELKKELPEKTKEVLSRLEEKQWCLDVSDLPFDICYKLEEILESKNDSELDDFFKSYFLQKLESMEENLINSFPHRARIIQGAFDDHRSGRYYSSVTLFLTQADGIFSDATKQSLHSNQYKKKQSIKKFEFDLFEHIILDLSTSDLSISVSQKNFVRLNRHLILHGKSVDYDTEINSLKALSYLNYVCSVFKIIKMK